MGSTWNRVQRGANHRLQIKGSGMKQVLTDMRRNSID
jgi:hypothetical protein